MVLRLFCDGCGKDITKEGYVTIKVEAYGPFRLENTSVAKKMVTYCGDCGDKVLKVITD